MTQKGLTSATLFLCCIVSVALGVGSSGSDLDRSDASGSDMDFSISSGSDQPEDEEAGSPSQSSDSAGSGRSHTTYGVWTCPMRDEPHHFVARLPTVDGTIHMTVLGPHMSLGTATNDIAYREWDYYVPSVNRGRCLFHCCPMFPHELTFAEWETDGDSPFYRRGRRLWHTNALVKSL